MAFDALQGKRSHEDCVPGGPSAKRKSIPRKASLGRKTPELSHALPPGGPLDHPPPNHQQVPSDSGGETILPSTRVKIGFHGIDDVSDLTAASSSGAPGRQPPNDANQRMNITTRGNSTCRIQVCATSVEAVQRERTGASTTSEGTCEKPTERMSPSTDDVAVVVNPLPGERDDEEVLTVTQVQAAANKPSVDYCKPADGMPWTRRIAMQAAWSRQGCHLCGVSTTATCRGCNRGLCIKCSRNRLGCQAEDPHAAPILAERNMSCSQSS